mmetsp:Transcript_33805/g.69815  ORF Transcript_33805/g.69815 Transcript_33805/m.69815 type:complete len:681 (-) Transcript_33805:485-2527(-)
MSGLSGLLEQVASAPAVKRPRVQDRNMGADPCQTLMNRLHQIRQHFTKNRESWEGSNVEIEAKLGIIVSQETGGRMGPFTPGAGAVELLPNMMAGKKFVSGVAKADFAAYTAVQEDTRFAATAHKQVTQSYTYAGDQRIQTDEDGRAVAETKRRELEFQIHLPACPYDCRVTVSIESPMDEPCSGVEEGWKSKRTKHRTSFTGAMLPKEPHPVRSKWQADLTRVVAINAESSDQTPTEAFEVELELAAAECTKWINLDQDQAANDATRKIGWDLWERIQLMMPREETAGSLEEVKSVEVELEAQRTCIRAFDPDEAETRSEFDFPGTMPIGFSRRSLAKVQEGTYYVSEKTDGVRYLLAVVPPLNGSEDPEAVFLDRRFKAFSMKGIDMKALGKALAVGTVLDGEVVRNRSWKKDVFMVFDCLSVAGQSQVQLPFIKRLGALQRDVINARYLPFLPPEKVHRGMAHLAIIMKHFYEAKQISEITRHITGEGSERVYLEKNRDGTPNPAYKRHHKSDGLIFAPDLPYVRGTDYNYMKWKWHDTITLDFETRRNRNSRLGFDVSFASQNDKVDFTEHVVLDEHDRLRLVGDIGAENKPLITEWEFCPEMGVWRYKMPRPDKKRSNFARTVLSTIMEIAEAMEVEELQYRLTFKRAEDDDWDEVMQRKRAEVLQQRRQRRSSA